MSERAEIPDLPGYTTVKQAARALGVSEQRIYDYINDGRLHAVKIGRGIGVLAEDVESFRRQITGRPRKAALPWRIPPADNSIRRLFIVVRALPGQEERLPQRLEEIRQSEEHLFPGTIERNIAQSESEPARIEIDLVWRGAAARDEAAIERDLAAFRHALADILDWPSAQYSSSRILMRT